MTRSRRRPSRGGRLVLIAALTVAPLASAASAAAVERVERPDPTARTDARCGPELAWRELFHQPRYRAIDPLAVYNADYRWRSNDVAVSAAPRRPGRD